MIRKQFIRFIVNDNGNGKIKVMNRIVKLYDDNNNFIKVEEPYAYATGTQIDVDVHFIEGMKTSGFMPLFHFKHVNGEIVKKSQAEIEQADSDYQARKQVRLQEIEAKNQTIETAKNIVLNKSKTLTERVNAMCDLIEEGYIK